MFGYRLHAWSQQPVWEDLPDPVPATDEVLIEVEACGVGLTVLNSINGDLSNDPSLLPRVPGHELVGRVLDVGSGVDSGLVGKRVCAYFYLSCGDCAACRSGFDSRCSNLAGWVGIHIDGGYAPRVALPTRNAIVIPDTVDPVMATVIPDAVATPVHVAARAGIAPGDRVAVVGAGGGVGIHMIQVAAARGAEVAGLDLSDDKLSEVALLGSKPVMSADFTSLDAGMFEAGAPTVVVDLLGTTESARWAIESLETGGRLVTLTTFRNRSVPLESRELVFGELSILGSRYATRSEITEAANLVASGAVRPVIGAIRPASEVFEIHEMLSSGSLIGRGALDWSQS